MAVVLKTNKHKKSIRAHSIKLALMRYYRLKRRCQMCCTEFNYGFSDFIALKHGKVIEVEVKVSKADLKREKHKDKHKTDYSDNVAHQFYFAVPSELVEDAILEAANIDTRFGVIEIDSNEHAVFVAGISKEAKHLHNRPIQKKLITALQQRLTMENIILMERIEANV